MKKNLILKKIPIASVAVAMAVATASPSFAGPASTPLSEPTFEPENPFTVGVAINSDSFFGFYPTFAGTYSLSDSIAFTTYGIFWNGGNTPGAWGEWTEFGVGMAYSPTSWLTINPQVGFLGGSLLSQGGALPGELGDGWVPNLTVNLNSEKWEGQLYLGLYLPIKDALPGRTQLEFLHYWANLGYKINDFISIGGHYESLMGGADMTATTVYSWFGPYIQFRNQDKGLFVRFAGGPELYGTNNRGSFWKISLGFTF